MATDKSHLQSGQLWFQVQIPATQVTLRCFDLSNDDVYLCTALLENLSKSAQALLTALRAGSQSRTRRPQRRTDRQILLDVEDLALGADCQERL